MRTSYGIFYADPEMANFETYSYIAPYGNQISLTSPAGGLSNPYAGIPGGDPFPLPFPPTANALFVPAGQFFTVPLHIHPPNAAAVEPFDSAAGGSGFASHGILYREQIHSPLGGNSVGFCRVYTRHVWREPMFHDYEYAV